MSSASKRRTPKGNSTLSSLEDISTSVKKRGAPNSFVFAEEEESADESSSSSSEEESSDEDVILPKRRGAAQQQKKKPAVATAKTAAAKKKQKEDEEQLDLFALLRKSKGDCGTAVANKWLPRADSEPGVCELLSLLLRTSGATKDSAAIPEFKKSASATLATAVKDAEFENGAAPIQGKSPENKRMVTSMSTFFAEVGRNRNRDACVAAFECCQAAAKSPIRMLRQAGAVGAMSLGLGLLDRTTQLRKDLDRAKKVFHTEVNECEKKMRTDAAKVKVHQATEEFLKSLTELSGYICRKPPANEAEVSADDAFDEAVEHVQKAMEAWRSAGSKDGAVSDKARQMANECVKVAKELRVSERRALEGRDSVFHEVAKARFRDVEPTVRAEVARLLGDWSKVCPDAMSVSHRSKYLGWMLYDKSAQVREEALDGLIRIADGAATSPDIKARFTAFATRFSVRIQGMFNDPSSNVVAAALRLCRAWKEAGLIDVKDESGATHDSELIHEAESLLFFAPERDDCELPNTEREPWLKVRKEAAQLIACLDPRLDTRAKNAKRDENNGDESGDDKDDEEGENEDSNKKSNKVGADKDMNGSRLRAFADLVSRHVDMADFAYLETIWAFEAFYPSASSTDEEESKPRGRGGKSAKAVPQKHFLLDLEAICELLADDAYCASVPQHAPILATVLLCSLQRRDPTSIAASASTTARGRKKAKTTDADDDIIARRLPDLLVKFRSDSFVLESLVRAVQFVPCFSDQGPLDILLRELVKCSTEKTLYPLLEASSSALSLLCEEKRAESKSARAALDRVCGITSRALNSSLAPLDDESALAWMARFAALACGTTAGSNVLGGEDGLRELFSAIKQVAASELTPWLVYALKTAVGCVSWIVLEALGGKDASSEAIAAAKRSRNAIADAFKAVMDATLAHASMNIAGGIGLKVLTLYYDTRTVFWPGNPSIGWNPSPELAEKADSILMDVVSPTIENKPGAARMAYEDVLIPMARCALYASPREDARASALILRFVHDSNQLVFKKCALRLNGELRRVDVDRWLQAHLETLSLDANHSEALTKTLGPSSEKMAALIGNAVSGMICRAIRLANDQNNQGLLMAVAPYLNFCKQGKPRDRIVRLWEQLSPTIREDSGNQDFGIAFEAKLFKTSGNKRRQSEGAGLDTSAMSSSTPQASSTQKKVRTSETGKKRGRKFQDDSPSSAPGEDEESSPRRLPKALNLVAKSASNQKKPKRTESEVEHLERSVFDRSQEDQDEDSVDEDDAFEDNPISIPDKVPASGQRGAAKASRATTTTTTKITNTIEGDDVEDDDDDEGEQIGFRPRIQWRKA